MFEILRTNLVEWNRATTDRQKLQHAYVLLLVVVTFIAGIVSLVNSERSDLLWYIVLAIITTASVNVLVWSLLKTLLIDKLPANNRSRTNRR